MNRKIARDPYLREVAARWGEAAVFEAGFFEDTDPRDAPLDDVGWLGTPTAAVRDGLGRGPGSASGPPVVLLSTGGFFPVHAGHLAMMTAARERAEQAGWWVVGGYLSPAHDEYIALKCGSVPIGVSQRIARAEATVRAAGPELDWVDVDPWEALARRVAVNFTDVTARLQTYLRAQVDPRIEVAFVAGADNARFALAFAPRGRCVVVGRPGHEATLHRWQHDARMPTDGRVLWTHGALDAASSALRPVAWSTDPPWLVVRLEDERAVVRLGLDAATWRRFQEALLAELARHLPVTGRAGPVPRLVYALGHPLGPSTSASRTRTLSLDPLVPGDADLAVSRVFDLGGLRALGHAARPDHPPVGRQLAALAPGSWRLYDDDRATGSTEAFVRGELPTGVTLDETTFAFDPAAGLDRDAGDRAVDIADSRDFLLGTHEGGLVIALPDATLGRAPYLLPFVDPSVRCGLPGDRAQVFSEAMWHVGAEVFAPTGLTVAELPPATKRTMLAAGATPTDRLTDVCRGYAEALADLAGLRMRPAAEPPSST